MKKDKSIDDVVKSQRNFFVKGVTKTYGFRMTALSRLEKALEEYESELLDALQKDLNKSKSESYLTEVGMTKSELKFVKNHLSKWMKPERKMTQLSQIPARVYQVAEPYGVVLIMSPWNYPILLCLEPLIEAIAAGNCVVLKPSAYSPTVSSVLKKMLESIYPSKYVQVIEGGREENAQLLEQRFDYIFFTGSVSVGKMILEKAARYATPVTLELGGKSPCIVDKSANLKVAAKRIAFGKILNAGQTCVAPDYLLVHEEVKEEFLGYLKQELDKMLQSDALENINYPKMINEKHFTRVLGLINGKKVLYGGRSKKESLRIEPTILDNISLESPVMQEEIFGPILPILTFTSPEELVKIITSFEKPLAFYLFTEDKGMETWALRTFSFGGGCINDTIMHLASSYLPFGGVGHSGMGSYHGKTGFETFSHKKSILDMPTKLDNPLRYQPYEEWKDKLIAWFI